MNTSNLKMTYRPVNKQYAAIDIEGEVTAAAEQVLMSTFNQSIENGAQAVILNFKNMEYMTSTGVGLLITLFIRANRLGKRLFAVGLNTHYQRIFELTRLSDNIPVFTTQEDVLSKAEVL